MYVTYGTLSVRGLVYRLCFNNKILNFSDHTQFADSGKRHGKVSWTLILERLYLLEWVFLRGQLSYPVYNLNFQRGDIPFTRTFGDQKYLSLQKTETSQISCVKNK